MIVALWISVAILGAAVVALALVLRGTLQVIEGLRLLDRPRAIAIEDGEGLPVGELAPVLRGPTMDGRRFDAASLAGTEYVVVLANSSCRTCEQLIGEIAGVQEEPLPPTIVLTDPKMHPSLRDADGRITVLQDVRRSMSASFATHRTPHVFVVGQDGRVAAQGVTGDLRGVRDLVAAARTRADD